MHYARICQIETYPHPDSMIILFGAYKQLYAFNSVVKKGKGAYEAIPKQISSPPAELHRFLGSCDGILCLSKNKGWNNDLVLWNPFTRSYFELPSAPDEFTDVHPTSASFVYDHINDDYKVVRWFGCCDVYEASQRLGIHRYNLCVFSLKQKSWKPIRDGIPFELPAEFFFGTYEAATANCVHWIVIEWSLIIAFDFGTYKFRKLSFNFLPPKAGRYIGLGCLDGCLSLVCHYDRNRRYKPAKFGCMDIWVMKEYGVERTWTKLIAIDLRRDVNVRQPFPIVFLKERRKLLFPDPFSKVLIYDLKRKSFSKVAFQGDHDCCGRCWLQERCPRI